MLQQPEKEPEEARLRRLIEVEDFEEDYSSLDEKNDPILQLEQERLQVTEAIMRIQDEREQTMLGRMSELEQGYNSTQSIWGTIGEGDDRAVVCTVPYTGRWRNVVQYVALTRAGHYIIGYKDVALGDMLDGVKYLRRIVPKELDREPEIEPVYGGLYFGYRALHKHLKSKRQQDGTIQDTSSILEETDSGVQLCLVFESDKDNKYNVNENYGATISPISHKQALAKLNQIYRVVNRQQLAEVRAEHKRMLMQPVPLLSDANLKRKDVTYDYPGYKGNSMWQWGAVFVGDHLTSLPKRVIALGVNATTSVTGVAAVFDRRVIRDQESLVLRVDWKLRIMRTTS